MQTPDHKKFLGKYTRRDAILISIVVILTIAFCVMAFFAGQMLLENYNLTASSQPNGSTEGEPEGSQPPSFLLPLIRLLPGNQRVVTPTDETARPTSPIPTLAEAVTVPTPAVDPTGTKAPNLDIPPLLAPADHSLQAKFRSGQTFLTWTEISQMKGERYKIYRSSFPINADNYQQAAQIIEVGENSSIFYVNRYNESGTPQGPWKTRYVDRYVIDDNAAPLAEGVGLVVITLHTEDFGGNPSGQGYYAVTITSPGGTEQFFDQYTVGPVDEEVADPLPVEITHSPGVDVGEGAHILIQYMDLRRWNVTFHAPNPTNLYYGYDASDPSFPYTAQYAYDYAVFEPNKDVCGGPVPKKLAVFIDLHGWKGNRYVPAKDYPYKYCAYGIYPVDTTETWYFGFARDHDFRKNSEISSSDVIENFTEQRVLRMVYDLLRHNFGPEADPRRVYVFGHSMGGSGSLGLGTRYPNVFAAAYAAEPITDYETSGVTHQDWAANVAIKWGKPDQNLPILISAPAGWAGPLQKYNGTGVWDWQDYLDVLSGVKVPARLTDDMAPMGTDHGIPDHVILWKTQGAPYYPAWDAGGRTWAGVVTTLDHDWSDFAGLPPSLAKVDKNPFWNFQVIRDESMPGISKLSGNSPLPPSEPGSYNQTVLWSSSWNPWDGLPVDKENLWQISLCSVTLGKHTCGGTQQTADITPRKLQHFKVQPNTEYDWQNVEVNSGKVVASGTVKSSAEGIVTVPAFLITPGGNRLGLKPHS